MSEAERDVWPAPPAASEPILEHMRRHRSVRAFKGDALEDDTIERAVEAAQCAATSSWVQAYHLIQVTDEDHRASIAELSGGQSHVSEAGAFFVICADSRRHRLVAERASKEIADSTETFVIALVDASLFAQNLCLAFESLGYGTCYVGGIRNNLPRLDGILGLPHGVLPLFGLSVGVPVSDPGKRPRLPTRAVWSKDRYPDDTEMGALIEEHDEVAAAYYKSRGAAARNWSGGICRKYASDPRPSVGPYYGSKGAKFRSD